MQAPFDVRIIADLSPPDWWSIGLTSVAAIVGAFIGAVISWLVAKQTMKESREVAQNAQRQSEEAATVRAELQLMELVNSAAGYHLGIEKEILMARQTLRNEQADTWLVMRPFLGRPKEININPDDLVAFIKAREFDFVSRFFFLITCYNTMIYAVEDYGIRREKLMSKLTPTKMTGVVGTIEMNEEAYRQLAPDIASMCEIADQTRDQMKVVYDAAIKVMADFGPIVRAYFKDPKFLVPGRG